MCHGVHTRRGRANQHDWRDILKAKSQWKYIETQGYRNAGSTNGCPGIKQDAVDGAADFAGHSRVGSEAILHTATT